MSRLEDPKIIGHQKIRTFLTRAVGFKSQHAFLCIGASGLGKETVARAFVADLLNRDVPEWGALAVHPDFALLARAEGKKNISIEQVRESFLPHFASSSFLGGVKVGVILDAETLSLEAANALLKTLEEPPRNALFILITTDESRVPLTVASRTARIRFLPVPEQEIVSGLGAFGVALPEAQKRARASAGRPGVALREIEAHAQQEETKKTFLALIDASRAERIARVGEMAKDLDAAAAGDLLDAWTLLIRDLLLSRAGLEEQITDASVVAQLRRLTRSRNFSSIAHVADRVSMGKKLVLANVNPRLILENVVLSL